MAILRNNTRRLTTKFHQSLVSHILPEFYAQEYPALISFLETYYKYTDEQGESFDDTIRNLFDVRDISSTTLEHLDYILYEIGDGLDHTQFAANPRLMSKLISALYRAKGTQISVEQFFKSFYNENIEVIYPKTSIFTLNGPSLIGPQHLHFIQDDKRYQIFSVVLKTGLSLFDYESLYKKFVHPAGWHLSVDVVTQSNASINLHAGLTTDPLEIPNYPIVIGNDVDTEPSTEYVLLTMRETDIADADIIISSVPLMSTYGDQSFETLQNQGFATFGDLVDLNTPATIDAGLLASSTTETIDEDYHK